MRLLSICLLWAGLWAGAATAQTCHISVQGILRGEETAAPLPYASIQIKELKQGVYTDSLGRFVFDNLCPGTYTFICDHVACQHLESVKTVSNDVKTINFTLKHHQHHLDQIEIEGYKNGPPSTQAVDQLQGQTLKELAGKQLGDMLSEIPGVTSLKTGPTISKPIIHGLHSNRVVILNNGIRQEGQQWGSEHAPEIDPFIANKLTVIKGANSLRYGPGAIGGVVLVEVDDLPDSVGVSGKVQVGGQSNGRIGAVSGQIEGRVPNTRPLSWRLQGTLKKGGNQHTPDYYLDNTGLTEQNFSANVKRETFSQGTDVFYSRFYSEIGILFPAHIGGLSDFLAALNAAQPAGSDTVGFTYGLKRPYQEITHHLAKVKQYWRIEDIGTLNAIYSLQRNRRREFDKHKPRGADANGEEKAELDFKITTHNMEVSLEHELNAQVEGIAGMSGLYQYNVLVGRPFIPNYVLIGGEAFLIERWKSKYLDLEAGIRYDYRWVNSTKEFAGIDVFSIREYKSYSANVGGIWKIGRGLRATFNAGRAWRPPHVNELFSDGLHHGAAAVEKGDSTLIPEQAIKLVAGFEYTGHGFNAQVTAYQQWFQNFIFKRPAGIERTVRGAFPTFQYAQTPAELRGVDATVRYDFPFGLGLITKGAYLRAWNTGSDEPLIFMPPNWISQGIAIRTKDKKSYLRIEWKHVFEQKLVPISENPNETDWLPPPPAYNLVNLTAGTQMQIGKNVLDIHLAVDNAMNEVYRNYLNTFRYYADEVGRNIRVNLTYNFN